MSALSNFLENKILDWLCRGQVYAPPISLYFALYTSPPTDAGGGTEVVIAGGYARVGISASLANISGTQGVGTTAVSSGTGGTVYNNIDIQFQNPTTNWGTVVAMGVFDSSTGGNLLLHGAISPSKTINNGDAAPKFAIGTWSFQLDVE